MSKGSSQPDMMSNHLAVTMRSSGSIHIVDDRRPNAAIVVIYDFQREAWVVRDAATKAEVAVIHTSRDG